MELLRLVFRLRQGCSGQVGTAALREWRGQALESAFQRIVASWLPSLNQVALFSATRRLAGFGQVGMQMRSAIGNGIIQSYMTLQPLMQVAGLCDVNRIPITVGQLPGINIDARQRP